MARDGGPTADVAAAMIPLTRLMLRIARVAWYAELVLLVVVLAAIAAIAVAG